MDIANILKIIRKKYKLTQKEIAKIIGVSHQTISLIERGDYKASKKTVNSLIKNFTLEFKEKT